MYAKDQAELLLRMLSAPRRNHFFYGKRMDVQHFQMEQDYGKHKQWLLNRLTLGKGVLCGLKVSVDGDRLCVDPGVAIDGLGREIIVPVRTCIDPKAEPQGCCGGGGHVEGREENGSGIRLFTLWLCYRECFADEQPVLVTDCGTRSHCAPGTVVESFCLKVTPGMAPLQGDPDWCRISGKGEGRGDGNNQPGPGSKTGNETGDQAEKAIENKVDTATEVKIDTGHGHAVQLEGREEREEGDQIMAHLGLKPEEIRAVMKSRRHALCKLTDDNCEPQEGDACVPLAVVLLRDQKIAKVESCLVRPRVYSNAMLLDLILCLAERVEHCCNDKEPPPPPPPKDEPMRVASISFLSMGREGDEKEVAKVESPLDKLTVKITQRPNAIRVRFTKDFDGGAGRPTTHGFNDPDFKRHNAMVLPVRALDNLDYVPGDLTFEDARTLRFDLFQDSPYVIHDAQDRHGWQKGRYTLRLFGDNDASAGRRAIADTAGLALDGEPQAPNNGAISGNGTPGGNFEFTFTIG